MRRVVVTGLGAVTPLANGVTKSWTRLINGESGVEQITSFDVSDLPSKIAAQVPRGENPGEFNPESYISAKDARKMDDFIVYALGAASGAIEDSGWKPSKDEQKERTGVMIGSGIGGLRTIEQGAILVQEKGPRRLSPFFIPSNHQMTVDGLLYNSSMKIMTLDGLVIRDINSNGISVDGDQLTWDGKNNSGEYVSSGVYLLAITNNAGKNTFSKITVIKK